MIKKNFLKILLITLFALLLSTTISNAAISAGNKTVNSGESVSILVTSNVPVVSYKVTMTGSGGLTFVTSSGGTGAGTATITDAKATGMTSLATYTFKTPTVTQDTTYTVSFSATAMEDEDFNAVANSTTTAKITVKAPATQKPSTGESSSSSGGTTSKPGNSGSSTSSNNKPSSNNSGTTTTKPEEKKSNDSTLKSLVIEGYELYPEFSSNNKEYALNVTNDIKQIKITPTVNDKNANYKIEGSVDDLQVGKNEIKIIVTAEDGTTSNYILTVTRQREGLAVNDIKVSYTDETGVKQQLVLNPIITEGVFDYTLDNISYLISKLDVEVLANLEKAIIEVKGNENLVEGENIITITVTMKSESEEETDEVLTYRIKVNKEPEPHVTFIGKIKNWFNGITGTVSTWVKENTYKVVVGSLMLCSFTLGCLSIYLGLGYKKYKLMLQKVTELNRMNNSTTVENQENTLQTGVETKPKGRHF